jgi:hypothetical protein
MLRLSLSLIGANRNTPRIEYMYRNRISSDPTLANEGIVMIRVLKTIFNDFAFLSKRRSLPTLKVLTIVAYGPNFKLVVALIKIENRVPITIATSKIFQPKSKYP